jgi:hypothetical protein
VLLLVLAFACSQPLPPPLEERDRPAVAAAPSFVNRVWRVSRSSAVAGGTLYVFLSDSTLVIISPGNKPMLGSWSRSDGGLVMVEESLPYQVEILELSAAELVIRSHNPGQPVDIVMVPAESRDSP